MGRVFLKCLHLIRRYNNELKLCEKWREHLLTKRFVDDNLIYMIDLAIRNGWLIDGTGGVRHRADIGIQGEQVVEIGRVSTARIEIDATDQVVSPGLTWMKKVVLKADVVVSQRRKSK